jgi:hypothetical protein
MVSRRMQELGICVALGTQRRQVLRIDPMALLREK